MTIPQYKKALCSMFVMSLCVNAGWSQVKVGSSPYGMSAFPGDTWPKSARTLSLGYFNIMGDQFDADISANPALGADVDGIYLAAGYYYDPFAEPSYLLYFGYRETDYLALLTVGRKFSNQVSLVFNSAIFIRHFQYLAGSPYFFYLQRYEEMSKSYSASLGYKLQEEIILGLKVNYSNYDLENVSNNSGISSDIINFDIGIEVRNLANKQKTTRPDNPEKFYSRWRNKRVTGINIAMALKNIGKQHENSSIQAINSPLDLCFGTSWLAINSEAFGVEFLANYKRDLRNGDYFTSQMRRFSYSFATELTYINFLKLRFGYFNLINQYENCTYGIGLGPPFLRLEYGRIDDFGLLDDNTNTFEDERELISLTFRNSFQL